MALADDLHHLSRELHELIEHPDRHSRDEMNFWLVATSEFLRELSRYVDEQPDFAALRKETPASPVDQPPSSGRRSHPGKSRFRHTGYAL